MAAVLKGAALPAPAAIQQLHHYAYRARDAEETRHFYEDILGLPLYHIIQSDYVPSTGEYCPYTHFFFRLQDGSFIAFFDLGDDEAPCPRPTPPVGQPHRLSRRHHPGAGRHEGPPASPRRGGAGRDRPPHLQEHLFLRPQRHAPGTGGTSGQRIPDGQRKQDAHARLKEWTARKEQWRKERAEGKVAAPLKPQQNDRPEYTKAIEKAQRHARQLHSHPRSQRL
jgi:glyoxylase I family protein